MFLLWNKILINTNLKFNSQTSLSLSLIKKLFNYEKLYNVLIIWKIEIDNIFLESIYDHFGNKTWYVV